GIEKGIFLKQNIDLKLKPLNSGTEGIKAVQAGEANFASLAFATMSAARAQGIPMKAIWVATSDPFVAKSDEVEAIVATAASGVTRVEDLVGKKIATTTGVAPDFYLKAVLAKAGISLDKVQLVNVQPPNYLSALESGLDAASGSEPYPELLLARLPGSRVVARDGGYVAQRSTISATEDWIAKNLPLAERLDAGAAEATQYLRQHKDECAEIASRYLPGIEVPILARAIGHLALDPRMSPAVKEGWESEMQDLINRGTLKQAIPFEAGVDAALIQAVVQKNPRFFTDLKPLP
ncbi:MAG: NrtA/SsuA/CpmA family ABC transporter substrate-binding protein, partial [Chloroflexi bacterium]|nr:NrtA/SsuA/CpmA family ABC transporter substrate-binding protein [Chloroflexota bacterium]